MREGGAVVRADSWTAWPVYWTPVICGALASIVAVVLGVIATAMGSWKAGHAQPVDPNGAKAAAAGAAAAAILLGLVGSGGGGGMGSGERMDFSFLRAPAHPHDACGHPRPVDPDVRRTSEVILILLWLRGAPLALIINLFLLGSGH